MLNLSETSTYTETYALLGKRLILGDKSGNSYVVIKERELFYSLLRCFDTKQINEIDELPEQYQDLAKVLKTRGFLNDGTQLQSSFNEYNRFSNTFYRKKFAPGIAKERNNLFFSVAYFTVFIFLTVWMVLLSTSQKLTFDIRELKLYEWLLAIIVLPVLVVFFHESGHFIASKIAGISVDEFRIGLYVIYPTAYLTYNGINISKTHNRLVIISGGIFAHAFGAVAGFLLYRYIGQSHLLILWILANMSMFIANALPLGASDGYFFLSTLLGIYNLRLKGYKAISDWMRLSFRSKGNVVCGLLLLLMWIISFRGLWSFLHELGAALTISANIINWFSLILIVILVFRFLKNIYAINSKTKANKT